MRAIFDCCDVFARMSARDVFEAVCGLAALAVVSLAILSLGGGM